MPSKDIEKRRATWRRYYYSHTAVQMKIKERNKKQRERIRQIVIKEKSKPCADCDQSYPYYVMDFDHRENKSFTIGKLHTVNIGAKKLFAELAKCDLVCSNCHRQRTWERVSKNIDR